MSLWLVAVKTKRENGVRWHIAPCWALWWFQRQMSLFGQSYVSNYVFSWAVWQWSQGLLCAYEECWPQSWYWSEFLLCYGGTAERLYAMRSQGFTSPLGDGVHTHLFLWVKCSYVCGCNFYVVHSFCASGSLCGCCQVSYLSINSFLW